MTTSAPFTAYLAADGFVNDLITELGPENIIETYDRLVLAKGAPRPAIWADNIWRNPQWIDIESIGDAAKKLKAIQRNWSAYTFDQFRRAGLITEKLPHVSAKPLKFPSALPTAPLGSWTLIEPNKILAASDCSSPVPNGAYIFDENKDDPPNRAYLKLWEILTRLQRFPAANETCLDLGASPGGWTWVLQTLGAQVISVDKAPLAPHIERLPNIRTIQQSAFALTPDEVGAQTIDWFFSDIICYPERLLRLVESWLATNRVKNMVCTIKLQGETDTAILKRFMDIPGSSVYHLHNNKHELTWVRLV